MEPHRVQRCRTHTSSNRFQVVGHLDALMVRPGVAAVGIVILCLDVARSGHPGREGPSRNAPALWMVTWRSAANAGGRIKFCCRVPYRGSDTSPPTLGRPRDDNPGRGGNACDDPKDCPEAL